QLPSGQRFLVTAYYAGGSLAERLAKGPIPFDDAARMVRQAAAGLGAAHARGIVHRDVKPANLLLDEHGTVKVADFGIAKLLGATSLTRTGASLGTPAYKSPEQSRGSEVDQRTDLWSLGVVLYELLTGRKPFDAEYEQAVVHSILAFEPQILETADGRLVPEPLRRIVSRAMAKDPDQRYQRAGELIADLDAWLRGETTQPIPTLSRRSTQIALGAAVVLSLLLAYTGSWRGPLLHLGVMGPVGGQPATPADDFEIQLSNGQHAWLMGNTGEHLDEAEACFEKALALRPESTKAKGLLAVLKVEEFILWHREEDQDQLDALLEELRPLGESAPLGLIAESKLSSLLKRYEEAEALARRAISAWQTCAYPEACDLGYVWLGEALAKQGKYEEAKAELESGLLVGGGRIRCRLKLAQVFEWEGDFNRASTAYEEVRSIDPDQTTMLNDYGNLLLKHRDFTRAAGLFLHLTTKTEDPVAFYNLGNAYYGQGLWEEAFAEYENAEQRYRGRGELTPVTAIAFGDVRAEQEDDEGARNWYRIALERLEERLASEASGLYDQCRHAVVLGKLGRLAEAERDIDALLENPPKQGEAFIWLSAARIAALKQDRRALETSARRYLELEPEPDRLKDDVAFKAYRHDSDYTHFLNSVMEDLQRR
ncbi:MAG: protein kinase, partial [Acidobacteria bacterium]|nr:protein kinase [Acidobacteriota bacterium]